MTDLHVFSMFSSKAAGYPAAHSERTTTAHPAGETVSTLVTDRHDLAAGARAMAPWLFGIVPFGLVIGLSAARADIPTLAGWLTGPLILAGSAQIAMIEMLDAGATPGVVVVAALVINLRLIFYSATMARYWRGTPWWWRLVAAYLIIDPSFAVRMDGYGRPVDRRRGTRVLPRRGSPDVGGLGRCDQPRRHARRGAAGLPAPGVRDPALPPG